MHLESSKITSLPDGSQAITFTIILPKVIDSALHFGTPWNLVVDQSGINSK